MSVWLLFCIWFCSLSSFYLLYWFTSIQICLTKKIHFNANLILLKSIALMKSIALLESIGLLKPITLLEPSTSLELFVLLLLDAILNLFLSCNGILLIQWFQLILKLLAVSLVERILLKDIFLLCRNLKMRGDQWKITILNTLRMNSYRFSKFWVRTLYIWRLGHLCWIL